MPKMYDFTDAAFRRRLREAEKRAARLKASIAALKARKVAKKAA